MAKLERFTKCDAEKEETPNYNSLSQSQANTSNSFSSKSWRGWRRYSGDRGSRPTNSGDGINTAAYESTSTSTSSPFSASGRDKSYENCNFVDVRAPICPRLPSRKVSCNERLPRRKELFLILALLTIGRYILSGAIDEVLDIIPELSHNSNSTSLRAFLRFFLLYCVSRILYPVGGFIADVYLGRYRVVHASLWFCWIAFALLSITHILKSLDHSSAVNILSTHVLPTLAYILLLFASGGFEPTLIPFGADQLEAASSNEISAYFYWYYFVIQIGTVLNLIVNSLLGTWVSMDTANLVEILVAIAVTTCGLVLHKSLEHWYFKSIVRENCLKLVAKVLWYAATVKRRLPRYRRAFRYGEGKISRINLAKQRYDGKFTNEQVEDVKTFCRLCLVNFCLFGYFFSMVGGNVMMSYRANATVTAISNSSNAPFLRSISPLTFLFINIITVLAFSPLVNHTLVPCFPYITIKARIAMGMVCNIIGIISAGLIEHRTQKFKPLNVLLLYLIPIILTTLPEVLTLVSGLEFMYAQAPESMKGMLIGLYYLNLGIASGFSTMLFYWFSNSSYVEINCAYYYWMILGLAVFGLVIYTIVACLYVNRRRPTSETEEGEDTRLLYNNITIHYS